MREDCNSINLWLSLAHSQAQTYTHKHIQARNKKILLKLEGPHLHGMLEFWRAKHLSGWPLSMPKRCCLRVSPVSKIGSVSVERMELIMAWHLGKSYI